MGDHNQRQRACIVSSTVACPLGKSYGDNRYENSLLFFHNYYCKLGKRGSVLRFLKFLFKILRRFIQKSRNVAKFFSKFTYDFLDTTSFNYFLRNFTPYLDRVHIKFSSILLKISTNFSHYFPSETL